VEDLYMQLGVAGEAVFTEENLVCEFNQISSLILSSRLSRPHPIFNQYVI
jgi:hypothetical protein